MTVSLLTPTANRPVAFALCERWMARQTRLAEEWIVADGGTEPVVCTRGQFHTWQPSPPGRDNFLDNLERGLRAVTGELVVFIEDDDYYAPTHVAQIVGQMRDRAWIAGDDQQRYYNLPRRCWKVFDNAGASLCQTAIRAELIPRLLRQIQECRALQSYGLDTWFWRSIPPGYWALQRTNTVVGVKGVPGQVGLGIGHRPKDGWTADPDHRQLRAWIGTDAETYLSGV